MKIKTKEQIKKAKEKVIDCILEVYGKDETDYSYLAGFNAALSYVLGEFSERGSENITYQKYLAYQI